MKNIQFYLLKDYRFSSNLQGRCRDWSA